MTIENQPRRGPMFRGRVLALAASLTLLGAACGDSEDNDGDGAADGTPDGSDGSPDGSDGSPDGSDGSPDGSDGPDAGEGDGGVDLDGSVDPDAGEPDAGEPDAGPDAIVVGTAQTSIIRLSTTGHDRLYGVTFDAHGNIYATGHVASSTDPTADFSIVVAKFLPSGGLDATFGMAGVTTVNVAPGGKAAEIARGIVVQSTGKIVVFGAAEHDPTAAGVLANDTDLVLLRFLPDGTPDASFGTNGVKIHDLGTGFANTNTSGTVAIAAADSPWSLGLAAEDKLVVHAAARAEGNIGETADPRTDTDWVLVRFTADGELDDTFSSDGKVSLDIGLANASARSATVLADGSIVAAGYTTTDALNPGTPATQQPVLWKVTSTGEFDATFATADAWAPEGVYFGMTVPGRAEAYGAALQGDHFVTMGYGPTPGSGAASDVVSFRFTHDGALDTTYGTAGATWIDVGGYGDNGRAVVVLPDNRVLGIGGGRPAPAVAPPMGTNPPSDGLLVLLTEDGQPDSSFGTGGVRLVDLNEGTADFFWAGAVAPDASKVAVVGLRGITGGDDAALVLLPLE